MTNEQFVKARLAGFAHREAAHHGGHESMLAVCCVVRNRQRAGWYGGDWMAIMESAEKTAACVYEAVPIDLRDGNFRTVLQQVDDVFSGLLTDRWTASDTEGAALYYAELNRIESAWFKQNILGDLANHPRTGSIGNVTFFR